MIEERSHRLGRLGRALDKAEISAALLWDPAVVSYFTGNEISGPNLAVVTASGACLVVCDEYDAYNFTALGPGIEVVPVAYWEDPVDRAIDGLIALGGTGRLGVELKDMRQSVHERLAARLAGRSLVPVDGIVADIRLVKSPAEIELIRRAASIVEQAYDTASDLLKGPTSERELAAAIYCTLILNGSDYVASQPYIKSGERALHTHARWGDRAVAPDDHVLFELGACVRRYHAALMRTRLPARLSPEARRGVDAVLAGREAHLAAVRPGVSGGEVHEAYLAVLDRYGVRSWNRHSSGYPFGIAFPPYWGELRHMTLTRGVERRLEPGMVLHVIAGLTEPDLGVPHIGLSECVLVTETGCERLIPVRDFL